MRHTLLIGTCALATLFLAGCGEEEKKKEREALKADLMAQVRVEVEQQVADQLRSRLPDEVKRGIDSYREEKMREFQAKQAADAAAKNQPKTGVTGPGVSPPKTGTPAKTTKKH